MGYVLLRRWAAAAAAVVTSAVLIVLVAAFGQPGWFWRAVLALWWIATIIHGWILARRLGSPPAAAPPAPAPTSTAPVSAAPFGTAPVSAAPFGTAPVSAAPFGTPPVSSAPTSAGPLTPGLLTPTPVTPGVTGRLGRDWGQRAIAAAAAVVVAAGATLIALDVRRIESAAATAHEAGNCEEAIATLDGFAAWHRAVDPYVTRRAADNVAACNLLIEALETDDPLEAATLLAQYLDLGAARWQGASGRWADLLLTAAEGELESAIEGDIDALESGFDLLAQVLAEAPDRAGAVDGLLTGYLEGLPEAEPCDAMDNLAWLGERSPSGDELDRATEEVDTLAPPVLVACGNALLTTDPRDALEAFQTLLDRYPDHALAADALTGVNSAETQIEAQTVRQRLTGDAPRYCDDPAPYRAAPPYAGGGPHLLFSVGSQEFIDHVPPEWRATDPTGATLIICATGPTLGGVLQSCFYEGGYTVSLHSAQFGVKGFELRTGTLAFDTTISLGGGCPDVLRWQCQYTNPNCPPPPDIQAEYSEAAFRNAVQQFVF